MPFKLDISCDIIIETTDIYQCNVLFMIKAYLFCFFSLHKCARFSFKTKGNIYLPLTKQKEIYIFTQRKFSSLSSDLGLKEASLFRKSCSELKFAQDLYKDNLHIAI